MVRRLRGRSLWESERDRLTCFGGIFPVVDMAPGVGTISAEFSRYLQGMREIADAEVDSRKEADAILAKYEPVRPFPSTPY